MLVVNATSHDVDLDSGRVLAPGESADVDDSPRHSSLTAEGLLLQLPPAPADPAPAADTDHRPASGRRRPAPSPEEN